MIWIGMDDTDNLQSRGTGRLARGIVAELACQYPVLGIIRHQLLKDPRVPCTKNNSSAAIAVGIENSPDAMLALFERVRSQMLVDFQPGSDPGLCVAGEVPAEIIEFGRRAQKQMVRQQEARDLAATHGILLQGLGGTEDGVIGALASVGLAASGEDGRYIELGSLRDLGGLQNIPTVLEAGIIAVRTLDGEHVSQGLVLTDRLRPARRGGLPIAFVEWQEDHWQPVKLD